MIRAQFPVALAFRLVHHDAMILGTLVWDIDRIWFRIGPMPIRYYGIFIGLTVALGYYLVRRHLLKRGYPADVPATYLLYLMAGFVIGARLGHCLFYHPAYFLQHPLEILKVWHGGIASHGAAVGLTLAAVLFHRRYRATVAFLDIADATVLAAAVGAVLVRIGNFFNSEIVGRVTDVPWAVVFAKRDMLPRHPSQLYEALGGLIILVVLLMLAGRRDTRPGLVTGVFLTTYFTFRFLVEFFKEYAVPTGFFTMGQFLSVPFVVAGVVWLWVVRRKGGEGRRA